METNERIVLRLQEEMERQGLTQKALALKAGLNETAVRDILKRRSRAPRVDTLEKLAEALGTTVDSLLGETGMPPMPAAPSSDTDLTRATELPAIATMSRDLPVMGTAVGGNGGDFSLNGTTVDYVRRPPALANLKGAFAIFLHGDSMRPRYDDGDLLYVHPGRPVSPGCDVLIEMHGEHGEPGQCLVKTLVRRTADRYILAQYNPPRDDIEVPVDRVKNIFRILRNGELLGI